MAQITLIVLCCILSLFFKHCPFHLRNLKTDWRSTVVNSAEEDNDFPWSAGHTFNVDHYAVWLICNENAPLAHFQLGSNHNIHCFPTDVLFSQLFPSLYCCTELICTGRELHDYSHWTSWGSCWPKARVSWGPAEFNFYHLVYKTLSPAILTCSMTFFRVHSVSPSR